jgi:hypothetical protein
METITKAIPPKEYALKFNLPRLEITGIQKCSQDCPFRIGVPVAPDCQSSKLIECTGNDGGSATLKVTGYLSRPCWSEVVVNNQPVCSPKIIFEKSSTE